MSRVIILRGLPASGKTSWAKSWVTQAPGRVRVNRDDLRVMLYGRPFLEHDGERLVTEVERGIARDALRAGWDVVVDDMNLRPRYVREWQRFARAHRADWEIYELEIPLDESVRRDEVRGSKVGVDAIRGMSRWLVKGALAPVPTEDEPARPAAYKPNAGLPDAWIVDIDGTLALNTSGRSPYDLDRVGEDTLNEPVADVVYALARVGYRVVFCSGREETSRAATEEWIRTHLDVRGPLYMRSAGDRRKDHVVKRELLDEIGRSYAVRGVLDDRQQVVDMWRAAGLTCLQVAEGDF